MKNPIKYLTILTLTTGYVWYLYTVALNWELISDGSLFIGAIKLTIPLAVNIVITAILYNKIKLWTPGQESYIEKKEKQKDPKEDINEEEDMENSNTEKLPESNTESNQ